MKQHATTSSSVDTLTIAPLDSSMKAMDHFDVIKKSNAFISMSPNDLPEYALSLLYAMLCKKTIIIKDAPRINSVSPTVKEIIEKRLSKIIIMDVTMFDESDHQTALQNLISKKPVNYVLTKREEIIIKSELRAYFRKLEQATN